MAIASSKKDIQLPSNYIWLEKKLKPLFAGLLFFLFCYLCYKGPMLLPDSGGYIQNATIRSPLYPLLLSGYIKIFGSEQFQTLAVLQLLAGFLTCFFVAHKLTRLFNLPVSIFYLIISVLLFPYYGPNFFGNTILTEALCYPLFLMAFYYFLDGLHRRNNRQLIWGMVLSALLVLTRGQFLFLYPAIGIVLGYIVVFERKHFKVITLILCFCFTMISANLVERTYQYIHHGQFKLVPFTGIQLVIAPLYLARATDDQLFDNPTERALFQDIWKVMIDKKINFTSLNTDSYFHMNTYTHFYDSYNRICWESLAPLLSKHQLITPYQIDPVLTHMAITLILHNIKGFFTLYLLNIVLNIGGIYFTLLLCVATLCALLSLAKKQNSMTFAYLLASLFTAGNYLLIALVEPVLRRYSAYTDTVQISVLLILVYLAFQMKMQNQQYSKFDSADNWSDEKAKLKQDLATMEPNLLMAPIAYEEASSRVKQYD